MFTSTKGMDLFRTTNVYKYILFWYFCMITLENVSTLSNQYVVFNRSLIIHRKYAVFPTIEHIFQRPRPPLADDAKQLENASTSQTSDVYDRFFQPFTGLNVQGIKSLYEHYLNANKEIEKHEFVQLQNNKQATLFDLIWMMSRQNSDLKTASGEENTNKPKSSLFDHFAKIMAQTMHGSFWEIGSCEFSSDVAAFEKEKTVIAVTQDLKQINHCYKKVSSMGSKNIYLSTLSTEGLQQLIVNISSDYKVLFSSILLNEFLTLSTSLLPHEFEELLARLFSLSLQTFIPNMNLTESSQYFSMTEIWSSPGVLFMKACKIAGLTCSVDMVWGFDTWAFTKAIYKVTVKEGFRLIHPQLCQIVGGCSQCYCEFGTNSLNMTLRLENGSSYTSPIDLNDVLLNMFLETGPIKQTKEELFMKLLDVPYAKLKQGEVLLSGSQIKIVQLHVHKLAQAKQTSKHVEERKNSTFVIQAELQNEQNKTKAPFLSDKDSSRTDFLWSREKSSSKTKTGIKFNRLWNREIFSNKYTTSIINNVNKFLERDQEEFKQNSHFKNSDERNSTEEENQIHKGLDYLHKSDIKSQNILTKTQILRHMSTKQANKPLIKTFQPKQKGKPDFSELKEKNVESNLYKSLVFQNILSRQKYSVLLALNLNGSLYNKILPGNVLNRQNYSTFALNKLFEKQTKTTLKLNKQNDNGQKSILKRLWKRYNQEQSVNGDQVVIGREMQISANKRKLLSFSQSKDDSRDRMKKFLRHYSQRPSNPSDAILTASTQKTPTKSHKMNMPKLRPTLNEEVLFDSMWKKIQFYIKPMAADKNTFSVFIYGRGHHCLFGRKVALLYSYSNVVTVVPRYEQYILERHRKFVNLDPQHNNLLLSSDLTVNLIHDIYRMPELFKFQILGLDIFRPIWTLGPGFLYYLGELLTLAQTTFLEIPSFDQLLYVQHLLRINNIQMNISLIEQTEGLIIKALKLVGAEIETSQILEINSGPCLLMIRMKTVRRKILTACGESTDDGYLTLLPGGVISLGLKNVESRSSGRIMKGIGLEMLLRIGLPPEERMHLFKKYLELEIHQDMCPSHIVWIKQSLIYLPVGLKMPSPGLREETMQILLNQLQNEIVDKRFSFMEYNSKESVGLLLAQKFPNSSFIALSENTETGTEMYDVAVKKNITNFLTSILSLDVTFTTKLLRSPDILRYQFVGYNEFLRLLRVFPSQSFSLYVGQVLSSGLSTFIQVPSSKILSLAASSFYPDVVLNKPYSFKIYDVDSHPLPLFLDAESKILCESAKADVEIEIVQEVLPKQFTNDGSELPWRLVRVDVKKLKTLVDHHFDFEQDGHKRKYFQHVISENKSHYEVYLIRETDGFKIPYGQVNAISLIALLRMGLLSVIKDRFYGEFLSLPLYEDMAPWNIVFRGGKLEYIDYDTKDVTFNKMVPAAYQIMAVLMNYERTVSDFGHCIAPAENQYGFEFISHCVGSKFKGPCPDSRYPVPCADNLCKATYIECLKSLAFLEHQYRGRSYETKATTVKQEQSFKKWAFNRDGPLQTHG